MKAALALPIAAIPLKSGAAEVGEIGITVLEYKEKGLMRIREPVLWGRVQFAEVWELQASGAVDLITGASPQVVTNVSGRPVQTITGASVVDHRKTGDVKLARRFGDFTLSATHTISNEEDYRSKAFGLEGRMDFNQRTTTLTAGFGRSRDRVRSSADPTLDAPRNTDEYLVGLTQVISPTQIVQSSVARTLGVGWYNDPYKLTFTFYPDIPGAFPVLAPDRRPDHRGTVAWLTRYRHHLPDCEATLQVDYRFYRDDWGIRAHTLEVGWQKEINERLSVRPALRYYTQDKADFYGPTVPRPQPAVFSSDQRLGSFGGLSPSIRGIAKLEGGLTLEATLGYAYNARNLRLGSNGSEAFEPLKAVYGIVGVSKAF